MKRPFFNAPEFPADAKRWSVAHPSMPGELERFVRIVLVHARTRAIHPAAARTIVRPLQAVDGRFGFMLVVRFKSFHGCLCVRENAWLAGAKEKTFPCKLMERLYTREFFSSVGCFRHPCRKSLTPCIRVRGRLKFLGHALLWCSQPRSIGGSHATRRQIELHRQAKAPSRTY